MFLRLGGGEPLIGIVHQKFLNQIAALLADVRQLSLDLLTLMIREIKVNMGRVLLPFFQQTIGRAAPNTKYFVYLINFIFFPWEQRVLGQHFKPDTGYAPNIHLAIIVSVGQQTLWRPVPPRANVFCIRMLRVSTSTRAEVG